MTQAAFVVAMSEKAGVDAVVVLTCFMEDLEAGRRTPAGEKTEADEGEGKGGKGGKGGGEGGGVVSISPFRDNVTRLLELTGDIQLGLYECPVPFKRLLTPEELRWAADTGERRGEE